MSAMKKINLIKFARLWQKGGKCFFIFLPPSSSSKLGFTAYSSHGGRPSTARKKYNRTFFVSRMAKTKVHSLTTVQGAICHGRTVIDRCTDLNGANKRLLHVHLRIFTALLRFVFGF